MQVFLAGGGTIDGDGIASEFRQRMAIREEMWEIFYDECHRFEKATGKKTDDIVRYVSGVDRDLTLTFREMEGDHYETDSAIDFRWYRRLFRTNTIGNLGKLLGINPKDEKVAVFLSWRFKELYSDVWLGPMLAGITDEEKNDQIIGYLDGRLQIAEYRAIPYSEYLKTDHWQDVRMRAHARGASKCCMCSETERLDVHHNDYDRLGEELDTDVAVVCRKHHQQFHDSTVLQRKKRRWKAHKPSAD